MADVIECTNHQFIIDDEDRRFKTCILCGHTQYRTDDELLADVKKGKHGKN